MFRNLVLIGWLILLVTTPADVSAQVRGDELKVLDRLVGSWKFEFGAGANRSTGEFSAEWILDGRFIQKKGFINGPDGKIIKTTSLVTYVKEESRFRTWTFMANGTTNIGSATWDSEKRALTETREDGQFLVTTKTDWSKANVDTWTMTITDKKTGKKIGEMKGKASKSPTTNPEGSRR